MQKQEIHDQQDKNALPHIGMLSWRVERTIEAERQSEINRRLFMRPRLRHDMQH